MGEFPSYFTGIAVILLLTSFLKIFTSLSIIRIGMGLEGVGFGLVILPLAFVLAMLVAPSDLRTQGYPFTVLEMKKSPTEVEVIFRPFLEKHADSEVTARLQRLVQGDGSSKEISKGDLAKPPFDVVIASFLLSELREAFRISFIVLIPLLVIDLLVVNVMMALGIQQMSHRVVAVPLKIVLFTAVNGWALLSEKLLGAYL